MKQLIAGKVDKIEVGKYIDKKDDNKEKTRISFRLREWTSRKFPEGHKYAGKTQYDWYECKAFQGIADNLAKQLRDGDYIVLEVRANRYTFDRKDVPVVVEHAGQKVELKATVPGWVGFEYIVDDYRLMEDAQESTNNSKALEGAQKLNADDQSALLALIASAQSQQNQSDSSANEEVAVGSDAKAPF